MRTRFRSIVAVGLAVVAIAAACGSGGSPKITAASDEKSDSLSSTVESTALSDATDDASDSTSERSDQELITATLASLPAPGGDWVLDYTESMTPRSLVNAGTCLDPVTFSTSTAGARIFYSRDPSPDGRTAHGQLQVSLRLTESTDAAAAQISALQSLPIECADTLGRGSVPGPVEDSTTAPLEVPLPVPAAGYRTIAHFTNAGQAFTYYVDLFYFTLGRARAVVEFKNCCKPIETDFEASELNEVKVILGTLPPG